MLADTVPILGSTAWSHAWPVLGSSDAILVRAELRPDPPVGLASALSESERAELDRLGTHLARSELAQSRGWLRRLLGLLLGCEPRALRLTSGPSGKPRLEPDLLSFSVSHSGRWLLFGFTKGERIGVDVERLRPAPRASAIARRLFAPAEAAALDRLRDAEQERAFFAYVTRKEAYLKASGIGIGPRLRDFQVLLEPDGPSPVITIAPDLPPCWLYGVEVDAEHLAAVALPEGFRVSALCDAERLTAVD